MVEFGGNINEKKEVSAPPFEMFNIEGNEQVDRTEKIVKDEVNEHVEAENSDATECSSSFGYSGSPDFHDDAESTLDSDGLGKLFDTRRKLSSSWRSRIHSIMWRCKWMELQIIKLKAQHKKYEKKLEECNSRITTLEGDGTKTLTFPQHREVRRKKRRRAEETNDIEAYMSNHTIFSYYDTILHPEKKKPAPRHHVSKNPEFWENHELMSSEDENEDEMNGILVKINDLHSQVVDMMSRVGKITGEEDNLGLRNYSSNTMRGMSMASYVASQLLSGSAVNTEHGDAVGGLNFTCEYEDDDVLIDNHWVNNEFCCLWSEEEEQVKKNHTIQRQTPLLLKHELDNIRSPPPHPHVATNDQTGTTNLDRAESSIRSVPNRATTSTKTTSNKRPKREGPAR